MKKWVGPALVALVTAGVCLGQQTGQPRYVRVQGGVTNGGVAVFTDFSGQFIRASSNVTEGDIRAVVAQMDVVTADVAVIEGRTNAWNQGATDGAEATGRVARIEAVTNALGALAFTDAELDSLALAALAVETNRAVVAEAGLVTKASTNGWEVGAHQAWLTNEVDPVALPVAQSATQRVAAVEAYTNRAATALQSDVGNRAISNAASLQFGDILLIDTDGGSAGRIRTPGTFARSLYLGPGDPQNDTDSPAVVLNHKGDLDLYADDNGNGIGFWTGSNTTERLFISAAGVFDFMGNRGTNLTLDAGALTGTMPITRLPTEGTLSGSAVLLPTSAAVLGGLTNFTDRMFDPFAGYTASRILTLADSYYAITNTVAEYGASVWANGVITFSSTGLVSFSVCGIVSPPGAGVYGVAAIFKNGEQHQRLVCQAWSAATAASIPTVIVGDAYNDAATNQWTVRAACGSAGKIWSGNIACKRIKRQGD